MNQHISSPLPPALRYAFISAQWHREIVEQAQVGFLQELAHRGIDDKVVDRFEVPGAFEIPLLAKRLTQTRRYHGIVAAALVVDGGIYRHDFVSSAVIDGLMRVQLDTDVPVFSVVLTPHHFHDHEEHREFFHQHFVQKGREAARAALTTAATMFALCRTPSLREL